MSRMLGLLTLLTMASLVGCSSDSSKPATPPDAGATTDSAPTANKFRVLVLDADTKGETVATNITVVISLASGADPVEAVADDTGVATFDPIDWTKGERALTTYGDKRMVWTVTGMTEERVKGWAARNAGMKLEGKPAHEFFLATGTRDRALSGVVVSGKIIGKADPGNIALVSTTAGQGTWEMPDDDYAVEVTADKPFRLFAVEWVPPDPVTVSTRGFEGNVVRWAYKEQPAVSAKSTVDFDFATATPLTPTKFKGKLMIPGGDMGALGGTSTARIMTNPLDSSAHYARYTKMDVSADKSAFEYEGEYVTPPGNEQVATRHIVQRQDGSVAILTREGLPVEGETVDGLPDPPAVTISTQPLYEPWAVNAGALAPEANVRLVVGDGREGLWLVDAYPDSKTVTPPKLPAAAEATIKGTLDGAVGALMDPNPNLGLFTRVAFSRRFKVTK